MATVDRDSSENLITSEARNLLQCFAAGLDEVVSEIAEQIASDRQRDEKVVAVEAEDVSKAGEIVISHLRQLVADKKVSEELLPLLDRMAGCIGCADT